MGAVGPWIQRMEQTGLRFKMTERQAKVWLMRLSSQNRNRFAVVPGPATS
jgi:hypothetical protein